EQVDVAMTLDNPNDPLPDFARERVIAVATATDTPHRVGGLAPERIKSIYSTRHFDLCIVKADGARARWIKSPGPHEPLIPGFADAVIPVVSAQVIGRRLDDRIAHRPKRLTDLLGIELGDPITPAHVSNLLSHPDGSLKGVGKATVIPLINMVDSPDIQVVAREVAIGALARTERISRIVLASMRDRRLVEVVER
ncbi:MAG TPA: putative selenium-dependent hydroxylase accessory protein YqeC, partial [Gammaproteobacteria bacterium]|nr:putative selenium-dependent hydroxylase accessory protein YqeC [Gammaproteobacteria bacterium]